MIVQDYFGGDILKAKSTDGTGHYRNRVNGIEVDFTKEQFPEHIVFPEPITIPRIEMVEQERYQILVEKVERILEKSMSYG